MRKWSRTIGLLFTAAMSVYADQAFLTRTAVAADSTATAKSKDSDVKVVDEAADPFVNPAAAEPATKPSEGQSVTTTDVSVSDAGTVEIHVNDANLVEVLRMLSLQSQRNIIASNQVNGRVTANLYGVTVREALDAILHANGYAYREKGNFIYVYTTKEIADIEKSERQLQTQIFRLFYTPAANVITMIKPVLSGEGQASSTTAAANGLSSGNTDIGGDSHAGEDMIVVTDYADNLEKIRKVIAEIDRRPQQVLIEATILRATLSDDNALGVDFNVVGGVDFGTITSAIGQITGADIRDNGGSAVGNKNLSSVGTGNSFSSTIPNAFKVGVVTNNISMFLSALEQVTDTTILANPKVLALNKQKGEVIVGRKDGYITTTVTENAQTQTVEFLDTGTRLIFRPFIGDDGYIRMEIHPEDSSGGLQGGTANLPFKVTTEVTSNVLVKDNHTIVIGGLFRESSTSGRNQVPGLGNIPLAGALFRQQRDQTVREEVIILLTPHIVKDDQAYAQASEATIGEMEKLRVGVRKGMMWWGREQMSECTYETAVAEMSKEHPDMSKVLWHLDCAINLNPKHLEAINLKEQLTGKKVWSSDNSIIRKFVTKQIMDEKANSIMYETPPRAVPITPSTKPVSAAPSTQPSSVALTAPSTQPAVAEDDSNAPSTQPAVAEDDSATPSTQPAAVAEETSTETSPATQPSEQATAESGDENASDSSVTDTSSEMTEPADELNK